MIIDGRIREEGEGVVKGGEKAIKFTLHGSNDTTHWNGWKWSSSVDKREALCGVNGIGVENVGKFWKLWVLNGLFWVFWEFHEIFNDFFEILTCFIEIQRFLWNFLNSILIFLETNENFVLLTDFLNFWKFYETFNGFFWNWMNFFIF